MRPGGARLQGRRAPPPPARYNTRRKLTGTARPRPTRTRDALPDLRPFALAHPAPGPPPARPGPVGRAAAGRPPAAGHPPRPPRARPAAGRGPEAGPVGHLVDG